MCGRFMAILWHTSMMEERGGMMSNLSATSFQGAGTTLQAAALPSGCSGRRYFVELKEGETTYVSWKKLVQESEKKDSVLDAPAGANPALEARISPETVGTSLLTADEQPLSGAHRFRDVIQKIETLYRGADSEGEYSDPADEQYDTDDSFIDDEELNDYFAVEKSKLKHSGFYIHRGALQPMSEGAASPVSASKKRKRRDVKQLSKEMPEVNTTDDDATEDDFPEEDTVKSLRIDPGVRMKVAARKLPVTGAAKPGHDKYNDKQTAKPAYQRKDLYVKNDQGRGIIVDIATDRGLNNREDKNDSAGKFPSVNSLKSAVEGSGGDSYGRKGSGLNGDDRNDGAVFRDRNGLHSDEKQKEVSPGRRMKGSVLERAIQDLEKGVAAICPPTADSQEIEKTGQSGGKNKRLPRDIKMKLAKVARLSSKQGKIPRELIHRLMGILGDKIRLPTLKYNLKKMVAMGITANQEKEGRLQNIKGEVTDMIRCRVSNQKAQEAERREGSPDDFQISGGSEKPSTSGRYQWDQATEDRICDLYDLYVEGLDEHKGPKLRKLYGELVNLWPEGWMDNGGIKQAVTRAKTRKKRLLKAAKEQNQEPKKMSKVLSGFERQPKDERAIQLHRTSCTKLKAPFLDNLQSQSAVKKELDSGWADDDEMMRMKDERYSKRSAGHVSARKKVEKELKGSVTGKQSHQPLKTTKQQEKSRTGADVFGLDSSPSRKTNSSRAPAGKLIPAETATGTLADRM